MTGGTVPHQKGAETEVLIEVDPTTEAVPESTVPPKTKASPETVSPKGTGGTVPEPTLVVGVSEVTTVEANIESQAEAIRPERTRDKDLPEGENGATGNCHRSAGTSSEVLHEEMTT